MQVTQALLNAALTWSEAGCSVVPARPDGSKQPHARWKHFQQTPPTVEALQSWFAGEHFDGLGLICGHVSGNLEMFEIEGRAANAGLGERLAELMRANGLGELWRRITDGYLEQTPSGGYHWLLRIDGTCRPPTKLAMNAHNECLIETKGEGGFTIVAPSGGRTHPNGQPWVVKMGSIGSIPVVTEDERDSLYAIATLLDESPAQEEAPRQPARERIAGEIRPGDDYNQRATWADILAPHGWGYVHGFATGGAAWRRPGKTTGTSATTGRNDADNLYVFSSSTPFTVGKPYSKFGAYALLEHHGDYSAAARALAQHGYGSKPTAPLYVVPPFDGTSALDADQQPQQAAQTTEAVSPTRPFDGLDLSALSRPLPPLDFLIDGRLTRKTLTLLGSKPGIGKSWLAQSAAIGVATGTDWLGHPCATGRVLYLDAENGDTIALRRLKQLGTTENALEGRLKYVTESMVFPNGPDSYRLRLTLEDFQPDLVIVDTLASIAPTAEAGTEEASTFLATVWHTVRDYGAAMILLCHLRKVMQGAGKDDPLASFRGAGHLVGAAHRAWVLDPIGDEKFILRDVKTREFAAVPAVRLRLVDSGEGEELRTELDVEGEVQRVEQGEHSYLANVLTFIDGHPLKESRAADLMTLGAFDETPRTLQRWLSEAVATGVLLKPRKGVYRRAGEQLA